ncbi:MAG: tRNA uridine-5-carboxymethylaminomethyl(34) synthesis GTPase MnmE [Paramuribaculum sp.]|nr:tRNA uridine-5-carboxymethylaminomethyl(34) synthesis GTPase MnmE [Paramuribaculum sp.]
MSFSGSDNRAQTVCAISTPAGTGGIAVARLSGPDAFSILSRIWKGASLADAASHTAHLGTIFNPADKSALDQAIVTIFRSPHSFTGEDVAEISVHGSPWIQKRLIALLVENGASPASAGEFTRRAFLNGRLDLAEAEAVADMIASDSRSSHRLAMSQMRGDFSRRLSQLRTDLLELASLLELELDFSEEDVEFASRTRLIEVASQLIAEIDRLADSFSAGRAIREGVPVAILGETNAGKSSLLNSLCGDDRAIVSDIAGTTRDTIDETLDIDGIRFRLTDTAGLRQTDDPVESIGIDRAITTGRRASVVLWVIDPTTGTDSFGRLAPTITEITASTGAQLIAVINKTDIGGDLTDKLATLASTITPHVVEVSAKEGRGLDTLRRCITESTGLNNAMTENEVIVTNARHYQALRCASESLRRVLDGLTASLSGDFITQDLREAIHHLGEITGTITTPDILSTIFSRFCIGK